MSLRKLITPKDKLFTLSEEKAVAAAVVKMDERNIGATLVANQEGKIIGIFSERDLLRRVVAKNLDPEQTMLQEVMSQSLVTIEVGLSPSAALELMQEKEIRHLPVVSTGTNVEDEGEDRPEESEGEIIGLLSIKDLLAYTVKVVSTYNKKLRIELDQYSFHK